VSRPTFTSLWDTSFVAGAPSWPARGTVSRRTPAHIAPHSTQSVSDRLYHCCNQSQGRAPAAPPPEYPSALTLAPRLPGERQKQPMRRLKHSVKPTGIESITMCRRVALQRTQNAREQ
jgi:hypothetical protein